MPHPNQAVVVRHPDAPGAMVSLNPAVDYDDNDVLVKSYPWAFGKLPARSRTAVEQATAEPGQKRSRGRAKKAASTSQDGWVADSSDEA